MKKIIVATAIMGVLSSASVFANDGTVNFTGEILESACQIAVSDVNVDLGKIAKTSLDGQVGKTSAATKFNIELTGCPAELTGAAVKFDGTAVAGNDAQLALAEGSTAAGVAIQIVDAKGEPVSLFTNSSDYTLTEGENALDFYASYVSTDATVTAGTANGVASFSVTYK